MGRSTWRAGLLRRSASRSAGPRKLDARGDLINTSLQRGEMGQRRTVNRFSGFSMRGARLPHRWETAKAVEMPRQPASTPLKRGVNETSGHSTENSEEPSLAFILRRSTGL